MVSRLSGLWGTSVEVDTFSTWMVQELMAIQLLGMALRFLKVDLYWPLWIIGQPCSAFCWGFSPGLAGLQLTEPLNAALHSLRNHCRCDYTPPIMYSYLHNYWLPRQNWTYPDWLGIEGKWFCPVRCPFSPLRISLWILQVFEGLISPSTELVQAELKQSNIQNVVVHNLSASFF